MTGKHLAGFSLILFACFPSASGQAWDTSGNGQLTGNYYFREVVWQGQPSAGNNLQFAASVYGSISFDGQGHYTISNSQEFDGAISNGQPIAYSAPSQPGNYSIAASGYGFMDSLIRAGDSTNVLFSNGVLIGSTTDNADGYNDLFFAVPVPSSPAFQGTYSVMGIDSPTTSWQETRAYTFQFSPSPGNNIGTVNYTGYFAFSGGLATDSIPGVTYSVSAGAVNVQFAGELNSSNVDAHFMSGSKHLNFSPDGSFFFGGSPTGWDMIVGVRQNAGPATTLSGLYYIAGMTQDDTPAASGYVNFNSGYGSLDALPTGLLLAHQRVLAISPSGSGPYDYTYSDRLSGSGGSLGDSFTQYAVAGGAFAIGFSRQPGLGLEVLVHGPGMSGAGVYVDPTGVVNAGSSAPFTAGWAPGELVSIYGTNLANTTALDGSLPTTLGGVQVLVNGSPAPIYYVSSGQINAVIPVGVNSTTSPTASLQVVNNGTSSNTVINYVGITAPGVFNSYTSTPAIQHADYSMVTPSSPVQAGETILVYLTGLGQVDSSGNATQQFTASVGGVAAAIVYAGTQSTVGGGYQMNITVPASGLPASGNLYLDIAGPDTYNSETVIPIGTAPATGQSTLLSARRRPAKAAQRRRPLR